MPRERADTVSSFGQDVKRAIYRCVAGAFLFAAVSCGGGSSAPGSQSAPTPGSTIGAGTDIAGAIASASYGDVVLVEAGSYSGDVVGRSGVSVRANGFVTIHGSVDLTCDDCSVSGFHFDHGSVWINGDNVRFENNELNGMNPGGEDYGNLFGSRITIRGNYVHGVRIPGDLGSGPDYKHNDCFQFWNNNGESLHDVVIEQNIFTDFVQGVFLANETGDISSMSNIAIRDNVFMGTDFISDGNLLGNPSHGVFVGKANIPGVSITNNLFSKCANSITLDAMNSAIVQGNVIIDGGTAYAVGDGTQASAFERGNIGNVLWDNSWNGYPAQGPDKYLNPLMLNPNSLLGADGVPWTADDGWQPQNPGISGYGPRVSDS